MLVTPDAALDQRPDFSTLIVCAGNQPTQYLDRRLLNWLRRLDRYGIRLGALDTGTFALAAAGLMAGYRMTLHWEAMPLFHEHYPELDVVEQICHRPQPHHLRRRRGGDRHDAASDRARSGHHAGADRRRRHGARAHPHGTDPQRAVLDSPMGSLDPLVLRAIRFMEENLEAPLQPQEIADSVGLTTRRLERLFRRKLNDLPARYYLKIRLQAARNLLFYSDVPIQNVALSCGFSGAEVFSRTFRSHFGQSPREFRSNFSTDRLHRFHPELV